MGFSEMEVSDNELWMALLEEQKNIDVTLGGNLQEMYAQWLWETGRNLMTSPLVNKMKMQDLVKEFARRTNKKSRYVWYSVKCYKRFPYTDWNDVLMELRESHPNQVISERFFLSLLGNKPESSKEGGELAPLHRGLKNVQRVALSELVQFIKENKAQYVKVYVGDYQFNFEIDTFESADDLPVAVDDISEEVNREIATVEENNKQLVADYLYEEAKKIVFRFWKYRNMEGNPDRKWVAREINHAKALLKMGLTEEDIFNILDWRLQDPFWQTKLTSLGILRSKLTDWAIEARAMPKNFEEFLNKNPQYDYRQIDPVDEAALFVRAEKLKEAVNAARKNGIVIDEETYKKLYNSIKVKMKIFGGKK